MTLANYKNVHIAIDSLTIIITYYVVDVFYLLLSVSYDLKVISNMAKSLKAS